ncbi:uncharacterized protein LOC144422881 isoform X2 [Styela clava]
MGKVRNVIYLAAEMNEKLLIYTELFAWMIAVVNADRGEWNAFGSYQYYVSGENDIKPYADGETFCKNNDGEMAMIKTIEIQTFIQNQVSGTSGQPYGFYIGLKEVGTNDTFIWNDNSELTYTNWNSGEPSSDKPEPCVAMGRFNAYFLNLPWYDVNCAANSPTGFVCQRVIGWNWGSWESWGSCECPGMRQRNRTCVDSGRIGPYACNDTASQSEICTPSASCNATMLLLTTAPNPQGKYWGTWSSWSECNCSTIIKLRNRTCINSPRTGPDACAGSRNETANCTKDPTCYTTTVAETTFSLITTGKLTTDVITTGSTEKNNVVTNATSNLQGTFSSLAETEQDQMTTVTFQFTSETKINSPEEMGINLTQSTIHLPEPTTTTGMDSHFVNTESTTITGPSPMSLAQTNESRTTMANKMTSSDSGGITSSLLETTIPTNTMIQSTSETSQGSNFEVTSPILSTATTVMETTTGKITQSFSTPTKTDSTSTVATTSFDHKSTITTNPESSSNQHATSISVTTATTTEHKSTMKPTMEQTKTQKIATFESSTEDETSKIPDSSTIGILRPSTPAAQTSIIGPVVGTIGGFLLLALIVVFILLKQLKKRRGRGIINTGERGNYNKRSRRCGIRSRQFSKYGNSSLSDVCKP